jgi:hypothetical protein
LFAMFLNPSDIRRWDLFRRSGRSVPPKRGPGAVVHVAKFESVTLLVTMTHFPAPGFHAQEYMKARKSQGLDFSLENNVGLVF